MCELVSAELCAGSGDLGIDARLEYTRRDATGRVTSTTPTLRAIYDKDSIRFLYTEAAGKIMHTTRPRQLLQSMALGAAWVCALAACGPDNAALEGDRLPTVPPSTQSVDTTPKDPPSFTESEIKLLESPQRCSAQQANYDNQDDYINVTTSQMLEGVFSPKESAATPILGEVVSVGGPATVDLLPPEAELEFRLERGETNPSIPIDTIAVTYRVVDAFGDREIPPTVTVEVRTGDLSRVEGCGTDLPAIGSIEFVGFVEAETVNPEPVDTVNIAYLRVGFDKGVSNAFVPLAYTNPLASRLDGVPASDLIEESLRFAEKER